jgi:DNA-binding transcriptional ArsR family regulator
MSGVKLAPGTGHWVRGYRQERIVEPLQVIAAPSRMRILELVWDREMSAGEIAAEFDVSWSAVSQHLRVLREAGFVAERRAGTSRIYRTDKAALGSLRSIVEDHWRQGLGRVKDLAEAEQRKKDAHER